MPPAASKASEGRYAIKVPSLIETVEDVANLPIVASPNAVVKATDLATIRSTFKDAETITRLNGKPAIAIEVKKRVGANLVEMLDQVKVVADGFAAELPEGMNVTYTQDKSVFVLQLLNDLQNHVMIAVILVFIVILYALSGRASLLIGLAIPSSFLIGILMLALMGYTINMIVLFSLILAVGMLVDDAIIVTEFAERRMSEGMPKEQAFELAAKRMAGPVIAATMTRVAAFSPLLFWPGIIGDFMKYLPITLIVTLSASMLYALVFTPALGRAVREDPCARRGGAPRRPLHGARQARGALPQDGAGADRRPAGGGAGGLRQVWRRRRVLPQRRARLRPALRPRARQPVAERDGLRHARRPRTGCSAGRA